MVLSDWHLIFLREFYTSRETFTETAPQYQDAADLDLSLCGTIKLKPSARSLKLASNYSGLDSRDRVCCYARPMR